jgi:hypothetical protein
VVVCPGILKVPADILNRFWIQGVVSLLKPPHGGFRSETAVSLLFQKRSGNKFIKVTCNGHYPTAASARSDVTVMERPWLLTKGNGFILKMDYSGMAGIFNWYYTSSPPQPQIPREARTRLTVLILNQEGD